MREIKLPSACLYWPVSRRLHHTFYLAGAASCGDSSLKFSMSPWCKARPFLLSLIRTTSPRAKTKEIPVNSRTAWARLPPSPTVRQSHPHAQIRLNSLTFWQDVKATSFTLPESRGRTVQCMRTRTYVRLPDRTVESNYMLAKYLQSTVNSYSKALWEIKLAPP